RHRVGDIREAGAAGRAAVRQDDLEVLAETLNPAGDVAAGAGAEPSEAAVGEDEREAAAVGLVVDLRAVDGRGRHLRCPSRAGAGLVRVRAKPGGIRGPLDVVTSATCDLGDRSLSRVECIGD